MIFFLPLLTGWLQGQGVHLFDEKSTSLSLQSTISRNKTNRTKLNAFLCYYRLSNSINNKLKEQ